MRFGGRWSWAELVLTHRYARRGALQMRFGSADTHRAVVTPKAAAAGRNLFVLGANVTQQCLEADLVDEILLFHAPGPLGERHPPRAFRVIGDRWRLSKAADSSGRPKRRLGMPATETAKQSVAL